MCSNPLNTEDFIHQADIYQQAGSYEQAVDILEQAVRVHPDHMLARANLCMLLEKLNRVEEAQTILDATPAVQKENTYFRFIKALLHIRLKDLDNAYEILISIDDKALEHHSYKALKYYKLAEIQDKQGRYDAAFSYARQANRFWLQQESVQQLQSSHFPALTTAMSDLFTPDWIDRWSECPAPSRPAPVQVIGFPRSGTTLIDQILQACPNVVGMEEEPVVEHVLSVMEKHVAGNFANCANFDADLLRNLRQEYFSFARNYASFSKTDILLDKNPFNLVLTGLMLRLFPDMKSIVMLRHPLDCVLSGYMQPFDPNKGTVLLSDLKTAANYYAQSFTFLEQIQRLFPTASFYELRYEDLISDPVQETQMLFEFLELDWHEDVLNFHANKDKAQVTSASYAQVSQPLYKSAVHRWKNYADQLQGIRPILAPWIEKFGYEDV